MTLSPQHFITPCPPGYSALKSLWRAREQWRTWERDRDNAPDDSPTAAKRRTPAGGTATDGAANFTSKISLMLIFPLIESQTRQANNNSLLHRNGVFTFLRSLMYRYRTVGTGTVAYDTGKS